MVGLAMAQAEGEGWGGDGLQPRATPTPLRIDTDNRPLPRGGHLTTCAVCWLGCCRVMVGSHNMEVGHEQVELHLKMGSGSVSRGLHCWAAMCALHTAEGRRLMPAKMTLSWTLAASALRLLLGAVRNVGLDDAPGCGLHGVQSLRAGGSGAGA